MYDTYIKPWTTRIWHASEISRSLTLQASAWVLLLGWFLEFSTWIRFSDFTVNAVQAGRHLCWPFFQSCGEWYFLTQPPLGNSHMLAYAFLFGILMLAAFALVRKRYVLVTALFTILFIWELLVLGMSMRLAVNYWYFHALYAALFLFATHKLLFLRIGAVLLYVFSGILKLHAGWLTGSYFTALKDGLLFIPDVLIPVAANAVIVMELVLVWGLLSARRSMRIPIAGTLFIFHVYSVLYVGYIYPSIVLPMALILFLSDEGFPLRWKNVRTGFAGVLIITLLGIVHGIPYTIEGDARVTGEGNKLGMYMFEANYQCASNATIVYENGETEERTSESSFSNHRCDPYAHYFYFKQLCGQNANIERVEWQFDTSIDGSDLMRIVDVDDVCTLTYDPFVHNKWIRIPGKEQADIMGPVPPNQYRQPFLWSNS